MKTKFIYLPKEILKNSNLRPSTKLLAFHLFHLCGWNENPTIDNISTLSKELSVDRKTVREDLSVLQDLDIIKIYEDNTFKFFINSVEFDNKKDLSNKEICNIFGDFFKIPTYLLYVDIATPTMREAAIMFFEFNFDVDRSGFSVKHEKVYMESVSTYYHINYETFKKRLLRCKEVGLFEYTVKQNGDKKLIIGAKTIEWERKWVRKDGKKVNYEKIEKIKIEENPEAELLENELLEKEEYTPSDEDREEVDKLLLNLKACFKLEYERDIKYYRLDDQIVWLRKRQK